MKIFAILPGYNAEKTLEITLKAIPHHSVDEVIVVDDCSTDNTYDLAKEYAKQPEKYFLKAMHVYKHDSNLGYGGNQKTCYAKALELGADYVVMIHPDYQYDPARIPEFTRKLIEGEADIILGNRIRSKIESIKGGMPLYKYYGNRFLSSIENVSSGLHLSEWHTGMRMYTREVLETIDFMKLSDDFVFDTQFLFEAVRHKFKIGEVSVPVKYFKEASSINLKRSIQYGLSTLVCVGQYVYWKITHAKVLK